MLRNRVSPPTSVVFIAGSQLLKAAVLVTDFAFLWLNPDDLPLSEAFEEVLFISAHGKAPPSFLIPAFGIYVGFGLLRPRRSTRRNPAISSALTVALSLQRLGLSGETKVHSQFDRQTVYISCCPISPFTSTSPSVPRPPDASTSKAKAACTNAAPLPAPVILQTTQLPLGLPESARPSTYLTHLLCILWIFMPAGDISSSAAIVSHPAQTPTQFLPYSG